MCLFGDIRNSVHEKSHGTPCKFRGISRNYTTENSAEFRRNFSQFRTEYGIDRSKKNRRNSVDTLDGGSIFLKTREIGLPSYNDLSTAVKIWRWASANVYE